MKRYNIQYPYTEHIGKYTVSSTEVTGSGELPQHSTVTSNSLPIYSIKDKPFEEIEAYFKKEYPIQYLYIRKKFEKKIKKLLKANKEISEIG